MEYLTPDGWLALGIPGAALLIVAIVIVLIFTQQAKSMDRLCCKIDELVTSFAASNLKLNEILIINDRDQKQVLSEIGGMRATLNDVHERIYDIDARVNIWQTPRAK